MLYNEEHQIHYLGEGDLYVFSEQKRDYGRIVQRAEGARVLDFGAHCGFFNVFVSRSVKPALITSIEPDVRHKPMLKRNVKRGTELVFAAVVDRSYKGDTVPLYLGKTFSATNSVEPFRGRTAVEVPVVRFQDLTARVDFIKCDCEGGEYGLDWRKLPKHVHTVAIEFHFHRHHWPSEMERIHGELLRQGFKALKEPKVNMFQKVSIGLYIR